MSIDDIADNIRNDDSADLFKEEFLTNLPTNQWPSYIDETTRLLLEKIGIGDTRLALFDIEHDLGDEYRDALIATAGKSASSGLSTASALEIGQAIRALNKLQRDLELSPHNEFDDPGQAIEAIVNKKLLELYANGELTTDKPPRVAISLPQNPTVADLVLALYCQPEYQGHLKILLDAIKEAGPDGLLSLLDEPRMVTPLWNHQREALTQWLTADCRGVVDMATATGKTVLGLAAIAHHFGALHPADDDLVVPESRPTINPEGRAHVLIVAHQRLILDQWQREFDKHLNIPEQHHASGSGFTVEYEWGTVHFWTADRVLAEEVPQHDLAILDETHHYLGESGFGEILSSLGGDVLALSGSLAAKNTATLERRSIPLIFTFTPEEARAANIIPECQSTVVYVPYADYNGLTEVTEVAKQGFETYHSGVDQNGIETAALAFETLDEARAIGHRDEGKKLAEYDEEFRKFISAARSRQTTRWNLSPTLDPIVEIATTHATSSKCVVLLDSQSEIDYVAAELRSSLDVSEDDDRIRVISAGETDSALSTVEAFDMQSQPGVLIGIGDTLGEGVDIKTADVAINRGRGGFSQSLIQRMGRVLRNPDGTKHAKFYHIAAIPTDEKAIMPQDDGLQLIETAAEFLQWGTRFDAVPAFEAADQTTEHALCLLEQGGVDAIDTLTHYTWPENEGLRQHLEDLYTQIKDEAEEGPILLTFSHPEEQEKSHTNMDAYHIDPKIAYLVQQSVATNSQYSSTSDFVNEALREYVAKSVQEGQ